MVFHQPAWCAVFRIMLLYFYFLAYKDHRNGIKKPKRSRYPSMKGVSRDHEW